MQKRFVLTLECDIPEESCAASYIQPSDIVDMAVDDTGYVGRIVAITAEDHGQRAMPLPYYAVYAGWYGQPAEGVEPLWEDEEYTYGYWKYFGHDRIAASLVFTELQQCDYDFVGMVPEFAS